MIDNYNNYEKEVKNGISQRSPAFLILFLIYINGVFKKIA